MPNAADLDLAAALRDRKLTPYRGRDVVRTTIKLTRAGDGLSAAMKIDPVELDPESTVYLVIEGRVAGHMHRPIEDTGTMELVQTIEAQASTIVDAADVRSFIDGQRERIQKAVDEAKNVANLDGEPGWLADSNGPVGDEEAESLVLRRNHMAGSHEDEPMPGCPICEPGDESASVEIDEHTEDEPDDGH